MDVGWLRAVRGLCTKMLASVSTRGTKGDVRFKKVWSPRSKLLMSVRCICARPPSMIKLPGTFCCWDHACMRRPAGRPGILISVCRAIRRIGPRRQVFREEDSFVDVHLVRIPRKAGRQAGRPCMGKAYRTDRLVPSVTVSPQSLVSKPEDDAALHAVTLIFVLGAEEIFAIRHSYRFRPAGRFVGALLVGGVGPELLQAGEARAKAHQHISSMMDRHID